MAEPAGLLNQLVRGALGRGSGTTDAFDGEPPSSNPAPPASPAPEPTDEPTEATGVDPGIVCVLSEKILLAWLRNRHQLLFPFALNLRQLDPKQAEILVHTMIAAAQADGSFDGNERKRIEGTLNLVNPSADETQLLDRAIADPKPLNQILSEVHDVQTGALVYAASLMAVDQRRPVNRYFLKYLSARLQLSEELVGSLEQRYRSSG